MNTIGLNAFVRRQTINSPFSHFTGTDAELINLVEQNFEKRVAGYRTGIVTVTFQGDGFFAPVVEVSELTEFETKFAARCAGEDPFIQVFAKGCEKSPAKFVDVILYHRDVLAETEDRSTDHTWEIVTINARIGPMEPMMPVTMARNMSQGIGGTKAVYTAEELIESILFWSNKVLVYPEK